MEFRDAVASAGPYANNLHLAPDNHASTPPLSFYRPDALPDAQPTESKHWRQKCQLATKNNAVIRVPLHCRILQQNCAQLVDEPANAIADDVW